MNYYNEIDPFAAAWLKELMDAGLIADGVIDTRSIEDVDPDELSDFCQCHFFAGIGTWSYALRLAGWPDDRPVWTGSCPCQPFSAAGKQRRFADERHLWPEFYRLIRERRPAIVVGEQVAGPAGLAWWDTVCNDLEKRDYACGAVDFPAASIGAPHIRQRLYWMAVACGIRGSGWGDSAYEKRESIYTEVAGTGSLDALWDGEWAVCTDKLKRPVKPGVCPLVDGFAGRGALLRCLGNAIVAPQAEKFIETVMEIITNGKEP